MYNVRDMGCMLKSMPIHQRDSKEIVKFNFVTSCFAFRGSFQHTRLPKTSRSSSTLGIEGLGIFKPKG